MSFVTKVFNRFLEELFEPVGDDFVNFDFSEGLNVKNLVLKPEGINKLLQSQDVDIRMEHGHVGNMKIVWTALPGIATLQIRDLDIRLRPNLTAIASREIAKKFEEMQQAGEEEEEQMVYGGVPPSSAHPYYISPSYHNTYQPIHDTTATRAVHCKIPRPPRVIRQAQYVVPQFAQPSYNPYPPSSYPLPSFVPPPPPPSALPAASFLPPPAPPQQFAAPQFPPGRCYPPQPPPPPLSFQPFMPISRESTLPPFVPQFPHS
eukprot:GHVS01015444.1.p1 GENE.GHVS01015444.1~~GHVS01015444.1.p1  ORF type:complete len:261 (+),score=62.52 GHVS01015444.1:1508-2290(+)